MESCMKIIKHLIIATLLFSSHSIFSMQALKKKQEQIAALSIPKIPSVPKELTSRPLLIFFDPSHAEGDPQFSALSFGTTIPIATALLQALSSKNAILIASSGLWNYILDVIERPQAELSDDTMMIQTLWKSCNFDP